MRDFWGDLWSNDPVARNATRMVVCLLIAVLCGVAEIVMQAIS